MLSRARIAAGLVILAGLAAYVLFVPLGRAGATHLELCPSQVIGLTGADSDPGQAVLDDLDPDALLMRTYQAPGRAPLWFVVVYHENARLGAHDPELCYRSQGFELTKLPDAVVDTSIGPIPVRRFEAVRPGRSERVWYFWYTAGRKALAEVSSFRDDMFFQGLKENRSFGAFVRVSTLDGADAEGGEVSLRAFVTNVAGYLPQFFPEGE